MKRSYKVYGAIIVETHNKLVKNKKLTEIEKTAKVALKADEVLGSVLREPLDTKSDGVDLLTEVKMAQNKWFKVCQFVNSQFKMEFMNKQAFKDSFLETSPQIGNLL